MKFSVIIPTFNRESIISRAIQSVLAQSFTDFELLVIDNGSTDQTREKVLALKGQDDRIHYHWQENSGSPAGSRNTGVKFSRGDWIAFLDSDDTWEKDKLERVFKVLEENPDLAALGHSARIVSGDRFLGERRVPPATKPTDAFDYFLERGNCLTTSAMVVKREVFGRIGVFNPSPDYATVEDFDLWMRAAKNQKLYFFDQILTTLYVEEDQLSRHIDLQQNNLGHMMREQIQNLNPEEYPCSHLLRVWSGRIEYYKGKLHSQNKNFSAARKYLWKAVGINPRDWRAWLYLLRSCIPL